MGEHPGAFTITEDDEKATFIAPGPFTSEMAGDSYERGWAAERMLEAVPLGRIGRPGEMDALLVLLLGADGGYISGQTIAVDGGLSAAL